MDSRGFFFKKWFRDDRGGVHSLYVERYTAADGALYYHCVFDGGTHIDLRLVGDRWETSMGCDPGLVQMAGSMIEGHIS